MKKLKYLLLMAGTSIMLAFTSVPALASPSNVYVVETKPSGYVNKNGWELNGSDWNYYENNNKVRSSWIQSNGTWYFMKPDGVMASNEWITWNSENYYLNSDGSMAVGEVLVNGKCYTFSASGELMYEGIRRTGMDNELISRAFELYYQNLPYVTHQLDAINSVRASAGSNPVVLDEALSVSATYRALYSRKYGCYDHRSNGVDLSDDVMARYTGINLPVYENLCYYTTTYTPISMTLYQLCEEAMKDLTASKGHYVNIVDAAFRKIGIGVCLSDDGRYFGNVQLFME